MPGNKGNTGRRYKTLMATNVPQDLMRAFMARVKFDGITGRDACIQLMRRVVSKDVLIEKEVIPDPEGKVSVLCVKRVPEQLHNTFHSMTTLHGMRVRWIMIQLMRKVVSGKITVKKEY